MRKTAAKEFQEQQLPMGSFVSFSEGVVQGLQGNLMRSECMPLTSDFQLGSRAGSAALEFLLIGKQISEIRAIESLGMF